MTREQKVLNAFLMACKDNGMDGSKMRAAIKEILTDDERQADANPYSVEDHRDLLARATAAKTDAVLREAVTHFLGRDDWTPDDVARRGKMCVMPGAKEVFFFDGVALVELLPVSIQMVHEGGRTTLHATRQYFDLQRTKEPHGTGKATRDV